MASTFAVTRSHLIFGICLPLALLLGYLLADAQDPLSLFIVGITGTVLSLPLLMNWYHPLLILCWNMAANPAIPGRPDLWAVMAFVTLIFAVLKRTVNNESRFAPVPVLTRPLLALLFVVGLTAVMSGGIGLGTLRSSTLGGKNYFYLVAAIAGFFVLGGKAIPPNRAGFYVALFFLPGLLAAASSVAAWIGPAANFVYFLFPPDYQLSETTDTAVSFDLDQNRLGGVATAATLVFFWLLARVGVKGIFEFTKPWRALLFLFILFAATLGGFRSIAIMMLLLFIVLFCLEKLWRTRVVFIVATAILVGTGLLVGFAEKLPLSIQRTFSFLPIQIDPMVRSSAESSSDWRFEMWREAVKMVPTYILKGKGYTANADDLYMINFSMLAGHAPNWEWAMISGDYHNGPLSLLIPFGIYGLVAFLWLVVAGTRFLYRVYQNSHPELQRINAFLFAYFLVRSIFFMTIYGAIAHDLYIFTGILGLSVALNVVRDPPSNQPVSELESAPQM